MTSCEREHRTTRPCFSHRVIADILADSHDIEIPHFFGFINLDHCDIGWHGPHEATIAAARRQSNHYVRLADEALNTLHADAYANLAERPYPALGHAYRVLHRDALRFTRPPMPWHEFVRIYEGEWESWPAYVTAQSRRRGTGIIAGSSLSEQLEHETLRLNAESGRLHIYTRP